MVLLLLIGARPEHHRLAVPAVFLPQVRRHGQRMSVERLLLALLRGLCPHPEVTSFHRRGQAVARSCVQSVAACTLVCL